MRFSLAKRAPKQSSTAQDGAKDFDKDELNRLINIVESRESNGLKFNLEMIEENDLRGNFDDYYSKRGGR